MSDNPSNDFDSLSVEELRLLAMMPVQNPFPVARIGFDGNLQFANEGFKRIEWLTDHRIGKPVCPELISSVNRSIRDKVPDEVEITQNNQIYLFTTTAIPSISAAFVFGRNITQQKQAQRDVQRMALIARETDNSVVITDPEGKIEWVNRSFEQLTGYPLDEIIGKEPGTFLQGPETDPVTVRKMAEALDKKQPIEIDVINYTKSKVPYWIQLQIQPVFNSAGILENFISIQKNITRERLLLEEIADNELKLRNILDSALDGVIIIDDQSLVKTWTPRCTEIFGYESMEVLDKPLGLFIVPERFREAHLSGMRRYLSTGIPRILNQRIEVPGKRKNGEEFPVELTVVPIKQKENTLFCAFVRDISRQKQNEEKLLSTTSRLTALVSNLQSGILVENELRQIALVNEEFLRLFNIPVPPESMIGADCSLSAEQSKHLFKHPEQFVTRIADILRNREIVINEELELVNGKTYERDYIPIIAGDTFLGNLWQYRDISERKENERQLESAKKQAESANEAKSTFLANMSHEIRTPLNAVYGIVRLLADAPHNPEQEDMHNRLLTSTESLLTIINEVLDFSKIEAGLLSLEKTSFNLVETIDKSMRAIEVKAASKSVGLHRELDPELNPFYNGDPVRLGQIILNLLSNAIKFTDSGSISLSCKVKSRGPGSDMLVFSVTDTGIGIDPSRIGMIFENYQQADSATTRRYGGTGLGLSISKQLVELMGGQIEVSSEPGKGSVFSFTIELEKTDSPRPINQLRNIPIDAKLLSGKKVLVVEDNEMNQFVARSILKKWNVEIFIARNGVKAVEFLQEHSCDLILMDKQMPIMNGIEATGIIRNELKLPTPIIALTADAVLENVEECLAAGMNDYVTKPFDPSVLLVKMIKALNL